MGTIANSRVGHVGLSWTMSFKNEDLFLQEYNYKELHQVFPALERNYDRKPNKPTHELAYLVLSWRNNVSELALSFLGFEHLSCSEYNYKPSLQVSWKTKGTSVIFWQQIF